MEIEDGKEKVSLTNLDRLCTGIYEYQLFFAILRVVEGESEKHLLLGNLCLFWTTSDSQFDS